MKHFSCIDFYAHSCLKPFSTGPNAVFKQHNPFSNHEIHVAFEHGFWLKSFDVPGQWDVMSLCSVKTKWPIWKKLLAFSVSFTFLNLFSSDFK